MQVIEKKQKISQRGGIQTRAGVYIQPGQFLAAHTHICLTHVLEAAAAMTMAMQYASTPRYVYPCIFHPRTPGGHGFKCCFGVCVQSRNLHVMSLYTTSQDERPSKPRSCLYVSGQWRRKVDSRVSFGGTLNAARYSGGHNERVCRRLSHVSVEIMQQAYENHLQRSSKNHHRTLSCKKPPFIFPWLFQNASNNGSSNLFPYLNNGGSSSHNGSPDMRSHNSNRRYDHHLPTI